jgi:sialate O-acetylesterase
LGYFPFLYVQLANYTARKEKPVEDDIAELREAQLFTLRYPNTGMAVTSDIGDANDIHPKDKLDVGKRLFLAALKVAYHENIVYSGPLYDSAKVEGSVMRLYFSSVGSGLISKNGEVLKSFAMAGADHQFYWANAVIVNNTVEVSCPSVPVPLAVRYSWESNPDGNLYNKEGLPASPFRTDQWMNPNKK